MSGQGQETVVLESCHSSISDKRLTEIRIVLIGGRELFGIEASGKSSTGNIILGRNAFDVERRTARSVQAEGEIHGRHVTVVDTPGWWWHYSVEDTPMFDRLEIMRCPTQCPPGPHVFLLVIPVDSAFPKIYRLALQKQLMFLSEKLWGYTIVLFTSIVPYDDTTFKECLRKWPDFLWILRKCQKRFHVLNINNRDDSTQVFTLLEKIEKMVAQNNGHYFESVSVGDKREIIRDERVKPRILAVRRQKSEPKDCTRDKEQHLTDIRIVILGASWAARSSVGNVILGEEVFEVDDSRTTVRCAVSHADVHGKLLTVVDTPGWYCHSPLEKTPEMDKLEIRRSVYLCPPGPHAILLTVPIAIAFNKLYQTAVEEHMGLLGEKIWSHTIVLFTRGDWLGETSMEERIEIEGEHLQWLMEQCGNRYHVINCKNPTDSTQVKELLEKIEEMVMENNRSHYLPEKERDPSIELELNLKTAKINMKKVSKKRDILKELLKDEKISDVRIVLLGGVGAGKNMLGNIILQGHCFEDMTEEECKKYTITRQCVMHQRTVDRWQVSVVDTPNCSKLTVKNAKEILRSVTVCSPGPHAFLLVLPVRKSFTKRAQQTVEDVMKLLGESVWQHTLILFTYGHWLKDRSVEEYIACEGEALQELVRKCGNRYHVLVNNWGNRSQVIKLLKMIEVMVARNRGKYFTLENKERKPLSESKTLTEEEWNKREDELIERMLEAAVVDLDPEELKQSRKQSITNTIPSFGGDAMSDCNSLFKADLPHPDFKVSQWLWHSKYHAASSGYDSISITSLKVPKMEGDKDVSQSPETKPNQTSDQ
ncbi:GTPase IMAP family member 8-like [Xyrauchen texanus]|uniref:GTPase IMAP family member 8-like n=1 Tax=Xyrauchen texanus TaxID=154827 RepID=UPI0022420C91|nr:GTPase IMAP family member 8-like [Xyrauchen texanus]